MAAAAEAARLSASGSRASADQRMEIKPHTEEKET
jgi:hypothetical protein